MPWFPFFLTYFQIETKYRWWRMIYFPASLAVLMTMLGFVIGRWFRSGQGQYAFPRKVPILQSVECRVQSADVVVLNVHSPGVV